MVMLYKIKALLIIAGLGNLIDIIATLYLTGIGFVELNPFMRWLLQYPIVYIIVKLGLMTGLLVWIWSHRKNKGALFVASIPALAYGSLAIYYIMFISILLR